MSTPFSAPRVTRDEPSFFTPSTAFDPWRPDPIEADPVAAAPVAPAPGRPAVRMDLGGSRWVPERPVALVLVGALAVMLVVGLLLALRGASAQGTVLDASPAVSGIPTGAAPSGEPGESTSGPPSDSSSGASIAAGATPVSSRPGVAAGTGRLLVHVVGQVKRPGVVRLPVGARVQDAVRAAGGPTRRADLPAVNLARPVVDGEQLYLPRPGEAPHVVAGAAPAADAGAPGAGAAGGTEAPVDLNTATVESLDTLPGVGPVLAQRILAWRQEHGRFTSVDELAEVQGIGPSTLEKLRSLVRV